MKAVRIALFVGFTALLLVGYSKTMARVGSGSVPAKVPASMQADLIHVDKSDRRLTLLRNGTVLNSYRISLGAAPAGHKQQEGDERTPTGNYVIDWRNDNSIAHLSLHISYPNAQDRLAAKQAGRDPGGNIMIHGLPNGWGVLGKLHRIWDWTNGCIAVTNSEMQQIWAAVPTGTPIRIEE